MSSVSSVGGVIKVAIMMPHIIICFGQSPFITVIYGSVGDMIQFI